MLESEEFRSHDLRGNHREIFPRKHSSLGPQPISIKNLHDFSDSFRPAMKVTNSQLDLIHIEVSYLRVMIRNDFSKFIMR